MKAKDAIGVTVLSVQALLACGSTSSQSGVGDGGGNPNGGMAAIGASGGAAGVGGASSGGSTSLHYIFVVTMENHDETSIIGNTTSAPYINGKLIPTYASASNFTDPLPLSIVSEPHYVWMEAGTNVFSDHTFTGDADPSAPNSTSSSAHLSTQMDAAPGGITWRAYQEGIDSSTGACPTQSSGYYAPKHDPYVFFQDVAGNPPSPTNTRCADHHREIGTLATDLAGDGVASYNFITPNLCDDMHGAAGCPDSDLVKSGDDWLAANMPALISFSNDHGGVIFLVWDEGESSLTIPFIAIGPGVKPNYVSSVKFTHGSLVKTAEEIFGLPILPAVASDNDFSDVFQAGAFPHQI